MPPTADKAIQFTVNPSGGGTLMQDWIARSTAPGVQWSSLFTTAADVSNWRFTNAIGWDQNPTPGSGGSYVRRSATEGIMGNGALELEQPAVADLNSSYYWRDFNPASTHMTFATDAGGNRGPGQEFWIQLRVKGTHFGTGVGGGRKIMDIARNEQTSIGQKLVWEDTHFIGIFAMYQGRTADGTFNGGIFREQPPGFQNRQPGSSQHVCLYPNFTDCFELENNVWWTWQFYVKPANEATSNGVLTVKAWKPGLSDWITVLHVSDLYCEYSNPPYPSAMNALALFTYETTGTSGIPGVYQWYDQIIVSHQVIARPQV